MLLMQDGDAKTSYQAYDTNDRRPDKRSDIRHFERYAQTERVNDAARAGTDPD